MQKTSQTGPQSTTDTLDASSAQQVPLHASDTSIAATPPVKHSMERVPFSQIWKDALLPYLGTRLVLVIVGLLATYYLMPLIIHDPVLSYSNSRMDFPQSLWLMWRHFDSGHYVNIAQDNYIKATPEMLHTPTNWAFYPLYPLLISGVGRLFGGSYSALSIAGLLISNTAALFFISYLYLLVRKEWNLSIARRTVLYMALFPTAFFLSSVFTEPLLLSFSVASLYYARRQQWWLSGLLGGLATLTRLQGIAMVLPLTWEYLRVVSERYAPLPAERPHKGFERAILWLRSYFRGIGLAARETKNWLNGLSIFLVPCGLLLFMLYGLWYIGDFLVTFHANAWGWRRYIYPPWQMLIDSLRHPILHDPLNWNFWTANIIAAFVFLGVVVWSFRRLPVIYALYTAAAVLLPLSSHLLNSTIRYCLVAFPAFILLALFTEKTERQRFHNFLVASFASIQAVFTVFFVLGLPIMA